MYYAHAFRWGQTNNPSHHVVAAGPDLAHVKDKARQYCCDRGGKYGVAVYKLPDDDDIFYASDLVAYYPSLHEEPKPYENFDHDVAHNIGLELFRAVQTGQILVPESDDPGCSTLTTVPLPEALPQWLVAKFARAVYGADMWCNYEPEPEEEEDSE